LRPNGCIDQDVTWYADSLGPGDFVLDGDPGCPLPKRGGADPPKFWHGGRPQTREFVLDRDPALLPQKGQSPLPSFKG